MSRFNGDIPTVDELREVLSWFEPAPEDPRIRPSYFVVHSRYAEVYGPPTGDLRMSWASPNAEQSRERYRRYQRASYAMRRADARARDEFLRLEREKADRARERKERIAREREEQDRWHKLMEERRERALAENARINAVVSAVRHITCEDLAFMLACSRAKRLLAFHAREMERAYILQNETELQMVFVFKDGERAVEPQRLSISHYAFARDIDQPFFLWSSNPP